MAVYEKGPGDFYVVANPDTAQQGIFNDFDEGGNLFPPAGITKNAHICVRHSGIRGQTDACMCPYNINREISVIPFLVRSAISFSRSVSSN